MSTTYAEPTVREPLKIEFLPPNSDIPVLVKQSGSSEFKAPPSPQNSQITRYSPSPIVNNLPTKQSQKFNSQLGGNDVIDVEWKIVDDRRTPLGKKTNNSNPRYSDTPGKDLFADAAAKPFVTGIFDELRNAPVRSNAAQWYEQDPSMIEINSYNFGRSFVKESKDAFNHIQDYTKETFGNAWNFYKNDWKNFPDFGLPIKDFPFELENDNEQQLDRERRRRKRENQRKSNEDKINHIKETLSSNCYATLLFIKTTTRYYLEDSPYSSLWEQSSWLPGRADVEVDREIIDDYGNRYTHFLGEDNGGTGLLNILGWDSSEIATSGISGHREFKRLTTVYHWASLIITRGTNISDMFVDPDSKEKIVDIGTYALDGICVYCSAEPSIKPNFGDFFNPINEPPPEPKDDKDMDCCSCADIAKIVKKTITSMKYTIKIPVVTCELNEESQVWDVKTDEKDIEVFAISEETAKAQAQIYLSFATQAKEACLAKNVQPVAAIPDAWQVAIEGDRPQLVVLFAEVIKTTDGKTRLGRSRYPISIPHYNKPQEFKPVFPNYKKGQYEGKLLLKDNSRLVVNAYSTSEAKRVIAQLVQYINPNMFRKDSKGKSITTPKIIERNGDDLKQIVVTPTNANFFSTGRKDMSPDWVRQFK